MKLKDNGGGDFDPAPAGTHIARCVQVIDLGTQRWTSPQYGEQVKRKIRLTFELPFETKVFDEEKGEQPIFVSAEFTASLNERAKLRGLLAGWRGHDFTEEELAGFEARNLLNQPAMVTIVHEKKGEKTYANINSISKLPKGPQFVCPPAVNPLVYFSIDPEEFDAGVLQTLPEWLQKKVKDSDEFKEMNGGANPAVRHESADQAGEGTPVDDDEIPF